MPRVRRSAQPTASSGSKWIKMGRVDSKMFTSLKIAGTPFSPFCDGDFFPKDGVFCFGRRPCHPVGRLRSFATPRWPRDLFPRMARRCLDEKGQRHED